MTRRLLVVGAHPDDCDIKAGGIAQKYADAGDDVRFVSMTNGDAGHHETGGVELARRRRGEAAAAAETFDGEYTVLDNHDGELEPTLENRKRLIRLIRRYDPDLLFTHRPNDYHPDHRYTSRLVQDSAYMVQVPNVCTDVEPLGSDPVIAYLSDDFERPYPFDPDVAVAVDDVIDRKLDAIACHVSQVYEWLPWVDDELDAVPDGDDERREWLAETWLPRFEAVADRHRDELVARYGEERGNEVRYAEAFEGCEYGAPLTDDAAERLFPE
ncbi:MAG: PIG-L deacetylase family protein [Halobacteriaceae archaeon]